jgi:RimJ/RimL family protein N-acetyltransferase
METERLLLRPFQAGDFDALLAIHSRPDVARYLYWEPRTGEEVGAVLEKKINGRTMRSEGDSLSFAVVLKANDQMIGDVSLLWQSVQHGTGEIGFAFHPDHQGRGYATEAARAVLRFAFEELELHRVIGGWRHGTPRRPGSSRSSGCGGRRIWWRTSMSRGSGRASWTTRSWTESGMRSSGARTTRMTNLVQSSARAMMLHGLERMRSLGLDAATVEYDASNIPALNLYAGIGFVKRYETSGFRRSADS